MSILLQLPEAQAATLQARAAEFGLTAEQLVVQVLDRELERGLRGAEPLRQGPFWKQFRDAFALVPDEVFEQLPADSATLHDDYLHDDYLNDSVRKKE